MMKIIGISGGSTSIEGFVRSGINEMYVKAVIAAGAAPVLLPITSDQQAIEAMVGLCDGIILSGGVDIHPCHYHEEILQVCEDFDVFRDDFEYKLLDVALSKNIPILGICRGSQMLNVYFGGTLYQDLSLKADCKIMHRQKGSRGFPCHRIDVRPDTFLSRIYQSGDLVNSYHHQAVKDLAKPFTLVATSDDGVVEAFENSEMHIYAVQFHPEMMIENDPKAKEIFVQFIERFEK